MHRCFGVALILALVLAVGVRAEEETPRGLELFDHLVLDFYGRTQDVEAQDLNGDGRQDIIVVHTSTDHGEPHRWVSVFFQTPTGKYSGMPDQTFTPTAATGAIAWADIDAAPGVEVLSFTQDGVWYQPIENGRYSLTPRRLLFLPTFFDQPQTDALPVWYGTADLDGDGRADLVVPRADDYMIFFQTEVGRFRRCRWIAAAGRRSVEKKEGAFLSLSATLPPLHAEDFNGDGRRDLMITDGDHFEYWLQQADHDFAEARTGAFDLTFFKEQLKSDQVQSVVADLVDVNGDQAVDMVVAYTHGEIGVFESIMTQVLVFFGRKDQPYGKTPDQIINLNGVSIDPRQVDINKDGCQDLVVSSLRTDLFAGLKGAALKSVSVTYYIYLFDRDEGRFSESPDYSRDVSVPTKALEQGGGEVPRTYFDGDFDQDGMLDMVTVSGQGRLAVYPGRKSFGLFSSGGFTFKKDELLLVPLKDNPRGLEVLDLNGDGKSDMLLRFTSRVEAMMSR